MSRMEIRLAGSGGQGVILASIILAAAALDGGKNVVQSQSYGPEARGGMCKAETIVSDEKVWFTKVINPTFLLALTQDALNKYSKGLDKDCLVMIDSSLEVPECLSGNRVISVPVLDTAKNVVGKGFTANIVAVAAINEVLNLVPFEILKETVLSRIPKGTEAINTKALEEGAKLIK